MRDILAYGSWHSCPLTSTLPCVPLLPLCSKVSNGANNPRSSLFTITYMNHFLYVAIVVGKSIEYSGDPLKDFTSMAFLDRFVYKNPKKIDAAKKGTHTSSFLQLA
jgi:hypothetical protein